MPCENPGCPYAAEINKRKPWGDYSTKPCAVHGCSGTMLHSPRVVPAQSAEPGSRVVPFRSKPCPGWICDVNKQHIVWD
jgi:hypothetical protein